MFVGFKFIYKYIEINFFAIVQARVVDSLSYATSAGVVFLSGTVIWNRKIGKRWRMVRERERDAAAAMGLVCLAAKL